MDKQIHKSISSDNNLFDLERLIKRTMQQIGIDDAEYISRVRAYLFNKHPGVTESILDACVAAFISTPVMTYPLFMEVMDAMGATVEIGISVEPKGINWKPEAQQSVYSATDIDHRQAHGTDETVNAMLNKHISVLGLTLRLTNVLEHGGKIVTVRDLVTSNLKTVSKVKGMGPVLIKELTDAMRCRGLEFGQTVPSQRNLSVHNAQGPVVNKGIPDLSADQGWHHGDSELMDAIKRRELMSLSKILDLPLASILDISQPLADILDAANIKNVYHLLGSLADSVYSLTNMNVVHFEDLQRAMANANLRFGMLFDGGIDQTWRPGNIGVGGYR